jgi:hypothetical protein
MRHDKLVPGIILIALGVVFLMHSFGYLHIYWLNILHLWPLFLVIGGINLIFANNRSVWATALKLAVVAFGLYIVLFSNFDNRFIFWRNYSYQDKNDFDGDDNNGTGIVKVEGNSQFNEPFHPDAHIAKLNISGGASTYYLSDTTNELFQASTKEYGASYKYTHHVDDSVYVLNFEMKKSPNWNFRRHSDNSATFKLNSMPVWDIHVETGASKLDFDLSKFKIRNMKVEGGAAAFDIKLGQPLSVTRLDVETGVSDVQVKIPANAACSVDTDSGLSSNKFDGFNKTSDNHYETPGFSNAANKIYIRLSGGVSDFKVNRY